MPDEVFVVKGVRKTRTAFSQKISVLWPICGRRSLKDPSVVSDVKRLTKVWRDRVSVLKSAGWDDLLTVGRSQFCRNCPPSIVYTDNRTLRPCNMWHICPWCYARRTNVLHDVLATFLPERGGFNKPAFTLLEVRNRRLMRKREAGDFLDDHLLGWQRTPAKVIKRLAPLGAYSFITLDPRAVDGQLNVWRFRYSVVAMLPPDWVRPDWLTEMNRRTRMTAVKSKKQLINVVGRTCRYPTGLIWGDPLMTIVSMNARRDLRCSAMYGCFRKNKRGSDDDM